MSLDQKPDIDASLLAEFDRSILIPTWELSKKLTAVDIVMFNRICTCDLFDVNSKQLKDIGELWRQRVTTIEHSLRKRRNRKYIQELATSLYHQNNFQTLSAILVALELAGQSINSEFDFILDHTNTYERYRMQMDKLRQKRGNNWYFIPWVYPNVAVIRINPSVRGSTIQKFLSSYSGYDQISFDHSLLVIGSECAGKTSLIYKAIYGVSSGKHLKNTTAPHYRTLRLNSYDFRLALFDTGAPDVSQLKDRTETAEGLIVVYDTSSKESFHVAETLITKLKDHKNSTPPLLLVGNKQQSKNRWADNNKFEKSGRLLAGKFRLCKFMSCHMPTVKQETLHAAILDLIQGVRKRQLFEIPGCRAAEADRSKWKETHILRPKRHFLWLW